MSVGPEFTWLVPLRLHRDTLPRRAGILRLARSRANPDPRRVSTLRAERKARYGLIDQETRSLREHDELVRREPAGTPDRRAVVRHFGAEQRRLAGEVHRDGTFLVAEVEDDPRLGAG